jgi:hypothetical protein
MWPDIPINTLPKALAVLTSMITPALLISACGTFILSTSNRLGRVIDRVRVLSDKLEELMQRDEPAELFEQRRSMIFEQMNRLSFRADLLQRSLTVFYVASGVFVATSVAIGVASLFRTDFNWIPVVLGILGACLLFYGSVMLITEARLAVRTLRLETAFVSTLVRFHTENKLKA